jgi:hypothetical protein
MASTANQSGSRSTGPAPTLSAKTTADPILRNALRYTISAREYALLHRYVLSRSRLLKRRVPTVEAVQRVIDGRPYNPGRVDPSAGETDKRKPNDDTAEKRASRGASAAPRGDEYNARAIRHSIRVFVATGAAMKLWSLVSSRLMSKKQE